MGDWKKRTRKNSVASSLNELEFEMPSWTTIYRLIQKLVDDIQKSKFNPDIIVGISRGGWIPARIISDLLENPNLANVSTEFYTQIGETKCEPTITQPVSVSVKDKKILLVDDVADTGKCLKLVCLHLKKKGAAEIKIASIYYKPWSIVIPDYYKKETQLWIVFPWEIKETVRKIIEKFKGPKKAINEIKKKLIQLGLDSNIVKTFNEKNFS
jgi:hypoxanthine phosphoribosyltransferase